MLVKAYLLVYNLFSAAGWAFVLYLALSSLMNQAAPVAAWSRLGPTLCLVQSAAILEVLHSAFNLVRSPVVTVVVQVLSRLCVLWGYTVMYPTTAQKHWSLYLMVVSWSLVEVPRYLFYATNLVFKTVPFPLFWLRYSLFAILYPTGITGEVLQIVGCLPLLLRRKEIALWYGTIGILLLYLPGSPFMFFHMVRQRAKSFQTRKEEAKKKNSLVAAPSSGGVDFPLDEATNTRSTMIVNQGAMTASIAVVDPAASEAAKSEKNWRYGYAKHFVRNVELSCASESQCLSIAAAGLRYIHKNFVFVDKTTGKSVPLDEAMATTTSTNFQTYEIHGTVERSKNFEFSVPYQKFDSKIVKSLTGKDLLAQLDKWVANGAMEADAKDAISMMVSRPEYHSTALKDIYFVLLGAGSAMGPLRVLLELGANVIAVDINRDFIWSRLIKLARNSPGTMFIPVSKDPKGITSDDDLAKCAGADLLNDPAAICNWVKGLKPGSRLVLGGYAYLDSALFVRLAVAMDAIMAGVLAHRRNAAIAFLCSPTDVFVTDEACYTARTKAIQNAPLWQKLLRFVLPKRMLTRNSLRPTRSADQKNTFHVIDGLAVAQGPNYALAKRVQHWRCMIARAHGHVVSTNIAPSTATASVVHNAQFAAAYKGMGSFSPMEIVYQDLSNAIMTALLLYDISCPQSAAHPNTPLPNPVSLFSKTSCHFGIWRMAYKCGSIGEVSALIGYARIYAAYLYLVVAAAAGLGGVIQMRGAPHTWF